VQDGGQHHGQSVVDPTGYLTSMSSRKVNTSDAEVSGHQEARTPHEVYGHEQPAQRNGDRHQGLEELEIAGNLEDRAHSYSQQGM
jgi:hypothetical protein